VVLDHYDIHYIYGRLSPADYTIIDYNSVDIVAANRSIRDAFLRLTPPSTAVDSSAFGQQAFVDFCHYLALIKRLAKAARIYGKQYGYLSGISWAVMVAYYLMQSHKQQATPIDSDSTGSGFCWKVGLHTSGNSLPSLPAMWSLSV
jgi:hypothetical protein